MASSAAVVFPGWGDRRAAGHPNTRNETAAPNSSGVQIARGMKSANSILVSVGKSGAAGKRTGPSRKAGTAMAAVNSAAFFQVFMVPSASVRSENLLVASGFEVPRSATVMDCRLDCGWASHWLLSVWLSFGSDLHLLSGPAAGRGAIPYLLGRLLICWGGGKLWLLAAIGAKGGVFDGGTSLRSEGNLGGEQPPGLATVGAGTARDDPAEVGGIHHDRCTARAAAPAAAGRAGEFESVGLAVAAGPLGHNVCDDDAVVVGGEHRVLTGCPGEV